jgi:outer membrane protein assembly factor BamD
MENMKIRLLFSRWVSFVLVAFWFVGCGRQMVILPDAQSYFERGQQFYAKKKWDKASESFNMALLNSPGGEIADDAQFYIGECHYQKKDYLLAISEYQQLIERYAYSSLVEDGYYKMALSYFYLAPKYQLDQENTRRALQHLQDFVDAFPDSKYLTDVEEKITTARNRLARKLYESAVLYIKLQEWPAATVYLDNMLETYYDTPLAKQARVEKAYCLVRMRKFEQYEEHLTALKNAEQISKADLARLEQSYQKELQRIRKEEERARKHFKL